jgi:large conductance mechanosensitive channel
MAVTEPVKAAGEKAITLLDEIKTFALTGRVFDLAVGVIIGGAIGKIVDSLVKDLIMPVISILLPMKEGYQEWSLRVGEKQIAYGRFLGELLYFFLVMFAVWLVILKFLGFVSRTRLKAAPPALTTDQQYLKEIRDLLAEGRNPGEGR